MKKRNLLSLTRTDVRSGEHRSAGRRLTGLAVAVAVAVTVGTLAGVQAPALADAAARQTVSDVNGAIADVGAASTAANPAVNLPTSANAPAVLDLLGDTSLTMNAPVAGRATTVGDRSVFDGAGKDSDVVLDSTSTGLRALVNIDGPKAPERYEFDMGGSVASLQVAADGGVNALSASGAVVSYAPAPWAVDANGRTVPTHYEVGGTTLVLVVNHRDGGYAYGITADPSWWSITKCVGAISFVLGSTLFAEAKLLQVKKYIKELGGVYEAAKLIIGATSAAERLRVGGQALVSLAGILLGVGTVKSACS